MTLRHRSAQWAARVAAAAARLVSRLETAAKRASRRIGRGRLDRRGAPPRFSIVVPIYDSPLRHLRQQLDSIAAQTFTGWECIVVDDGSPDDGPGGLAASFAAVDHRFTLVRRPVNGGIAAATNDGLDRARGEWIVFCDHDDLLYPHALATLDAHIETHPTDDLVYSDEELIDEDGALLHPHRKPDFSPERFLANNYLCHLVAMRATLVDRIGRLVTGYEPSADRDFNMRASHAARSIGHIDEVLYGWRAIPGSVAKAITEKPNVARSVLITAQAHLERLGEAATASMLPGGEAMVRITWPAVDDPVEQIVLTGDVTAGEIDALLHSSTARFVALVPADVVAGIADGGTGHGAEDASWLTPLTAQCARPGVGVAGPLLVTSDDRLVSAGRTHHPTAADLFPGIEATNPGPFGSFLVSREVASVSPLGAVFDREAALSVGGFDIERIISAPGVRGTGFSAPAVVDITTAVLCTALHLRGMATIWTPQSRLVLAPMVLLSEAERAERAELHRLVAGRYRALDADAYSPIGVHRI